MRPQEWKSSSGWGPSGFSPTPRTLGTFPPFSSGRVQVPKFEMWNALPHLKEKEEITLARVEATYPYNVSKTHPVKLKYKRVANRWFFKNIFLSSIGLKIANVDFIHLIEKFWLKQRMQNYLFNVLSNIHGTYPISCVLTVTYLRKEK